MHHLTPGNPEPEVELAENADFGGLDGGFDTTPETHRQAQTWQNMKGKYLARGLCHKCSAQAAWGHQNGFATIHEPCPDCYVLVQSLPVNKSGPWRGIESKKWGAAAEATAPTGENS